MATGLILQKRILELAPHGSEVYLNKEHVTVILSSVLTLQERRRLSAQIIGAIDDRGLSKAFAQGVKLIY